MHKRSRLLSCKTIDICHSQSQASMKKIYHLAFTASVLHCVYPQCITCCRRCSRAWLEPQPRTVDSFGFVASSRTSFTVTLICSAYVNYLLRSTIAPDLCKLLREPVVAFVHPLLQLQYCRTSRYSGRTAHQIITGSAPRRCQRGRLERKYRSFQ